MIQTINDTCRANREKRARTMLRKVKVKLTRKGIGSIPAAIEDNAEQVTKAWN